MGAAHLLTVDVIDVTVHMVEDFNSLDTGDDFSVEVECDVGGIDVADLLQIGAVGSDAVATLGLFESFITSHHVALDNFIALEDNLRSIVVQGEVAEDGPLVGLGVVVHDTYLDDVAFSFKGEIQGYLSTAIVEVIFGFCHIVHHTLIHARNQNLVVSGIEIGGVVACAVESCHTKLIGALAQGEGLVEVEGAVVELGLAIISCGTRS